jgi:molecular chaperone DnaJ
VKDYYKILEVSSAASLADIKKSYRRLALQYHPDKNFGNNISEARFKEIVEAYKVLSDGQKRDAYNHRRNKQFFDKAHKKPPPVVTPTLILLQAMEFRRKVTQLDPDRMNKQAVFQHIQHLLSKANIHLLQRTSDAEVNQRIVEEILLASRYLPFVFVEKICFQLAAIAGANNGLYQKIYSFSKKSRMHDYWNKYKVIAALLFTILFCLLIVIVSKGL